MYVPDSYRTSVLFATLSTYFSLISSFCSLGQMFAADFFQIPPRNGHPCLSGYTIPTIRARWGLTPVRQYSCRAYKQEKTGFLLFSLVFVGFTVNREAVHITEKRYECINEKGNQVRAGDTRRHHQRGPHGLGNHGLHEMTPPNLPCLGEAFSSPPKQGESEGVLIVSINWRNTAPRWPGTTMW